MFGVVLITHGNLGEEFLNAVQHILGNQKQIRSIPIYSDDDVEKCRRELLEYSKDVDSGDGVVILSDMFGGTPSNLAISVMEHGNFEVMAGINLPILVKLLTIREKTPLQQAVLEAKETGKKHIHVASSLLKNHG